MYKIPKKIEARISSGVKAFQPVLRAANMRDVNESDTVTIIIDILSEVFGYDKYQEVTKEFQIRNTYCDLATIVNGKIGILIEVKAIGISLKDIHVKQAVDYAGNQGVDWVVLTNGIDWNIYKVIFAKPINHELVYSFSFLELSPKSKKDIELLFPLTKEGSVKSTLEFFHDQRQALSRFYLGALILSDQYLNYIKRDLRKISPGIKIEIDEIKDVIKNEVIKREVLESEKISEASKKISRLFNKKTRRTKQPENQTVITTTNTSMPAPNPDQHEDSY